jgi:predicted nucleic acid-binding protein
VRFWDSSALVPILVEEDLSPAVIAFYGRDEGAFVWWSTEIECLSAIARLEREGQLSPQTAVSAIQRLAALGRNWNTIEPAEAVRRTARRFLRVHPLRAADALQLAAAFQAAEGQPASLSFVSLDDRLVLAAQREGFPVIDKIELKTFPAKPFEDEKG